MGNAGDYAAELADLRLTINNPLKVGVFEENTNVTHTHFKMHKVSCQIGIRGVVLFVVSDCL